MYRQQTEGAEGIATMEHLLTTLNADTRNSMHSILGMLELIAEAPLTAAQRDYLRACRESADRLLRAVVDISELLHPAEPNTRETAAFNLTEMVREAADIMGTLARKKGLHYVCEWQGSLDAAVLGECERLENILVRLLDNAIRVTNAGTIRLCTGIFPAGPGAVQVEFTVTDGAPVSRTGFPPVSGRVLGSPEQDLLIVRELIGRMGGQCTIAAAPEGGSEVRIGLRFSTVEQWESQVQSQAWLELRPPSSRALNLLVAEDSDDSYYLLEAYLNGQGHRMTRAVDGAQCVELFKAGQYDLVFMDIWMPLVDGYQATRALREWETFMGRRRTPIIVLSAEDIESQKRTGATVGCSGYLTKPVSKAVLLSALDRYAGGLPQ